MSVFYFSLYQPLSFVLLCITIPQNGGDVNGADRENTYRSLQFTPREL